MSTTKIYDYKVTKSNDLIDAAYSMTINEIRIFEACVCQIDSKKRLEGNELFIITVEEAKDLFYTKANERNAFRDLSAACERLLKRQARIQLSDKRYLKTNFVQSVEFDEKVNQVKIRFAHDLIPFISELHKAFTSYKLKYTTNFNSIYAHRLYQLIVMWHGKKKHSPIEVEIEKFREMLVIGDKYSSVSMFRNKVIDPAVSDINKYSDFVVDVVFKKNGRKIEWLQISFERSAEAEKEALDARKIHDNRELEKLEKEAKHKFNQEMKEKRIQDEEESKKKEKFKLMCAMFEEIPNGTKYIDQDNCIWEKEEKGMYCQELRSSLTVLQSCKIIQFWEKL